MTGTSVGCLDGDSCGWEVIGTDNERREAFVMVGLGRRAQWYRHVISGERSSSRSVERVSNRTIAN
jgi:hypothetical protein